MGVEPTKSRELSPREQLHRAARTLAKRRSLALKVALLVLAAIGASTLMVTPRYKATASLYVRMEQPPVDPLSQNGGRSSHLGAVSPLAVLNSYVETLLSRTTAEEVVRDLELDALPPSMALRDRMKRALTGAISGAISFVSRAMAGGVSEEEEDTFRETVDDLRDTVTAEIDQDTELILVTVLYPDRKLAHDICQTMADIMVSWATAVTRADARAAHEAVAGAIPAATARLEEADRALSDFKRQEGIVDLTDEQRLRVEQLGNLEMQHAQAKAAQTEAAARLAAAEHSLEESRQPVALTTVLAESPQVREIKSDLYQREQQLAALLSTHTEEHPEVIRLTSQIDAARQRLAREVERVAVSETQGLPPEYSTLVQALVTFESEHIGMKAREEAIGVLLDSFRARLSLLPAKEQRLAELARDQQAALSDYALLVERAGHLQMASQLGGPPVAITVIDPPRLPKGISDIGSPPYVIILILGPILSVLIGLTAAFVAEYFDDTLGTQEEVADRLSLPVLVAIPHRAEDGYDRGGGSPGPQTRGGGPGSSGAGPVGQSPSGAGATAGKDDGAALASAWETESAGSALADTDGQAAGGRQPDRLEVGLGAFRRHIWKGVAVAFALGVALGALSHLYS